MLKPVKCLNLFLLCCEHEVFFFPSQFHRKVELIRVEQGRGRERRVVPFSQIGRRGAEQAGQTWGGGREDENWKERRGRGGDGGGG